MKLLVEMKTVYGNNLVYPMNDIAVKFTQLLGQKTLKLEQLRQIRELGYEIEVVQSKKFEF